MVELEVVGAYFQNIHDDGYGVFLSHNQEEAETILSRLAQNWDNEQYRNLVINANKYQDIRGVIDKLKKLHNCNSLDYKEKAIAILKELEV